MLLGANGCGKSTTLRVIAGLLTADTGAFHVDRPFGMVFQNPDHQVVLPTVAADVAFGLGRYNLTNKQVIAAIHHALERVGLATYSDRPTSSLSGGQKQRVAIAGALAENPRVLLLDELTTFLDARDQRNVLECVRDLVHPRNNSSSSNMIESSSMEDNPVTALWVTHRLEELEFADGVSIMDNGKVIFTGTPKEALAVMKRLGAKI
jgi:energy-coupling factor transport system ATP-binding protein